MTVCYFTATGNSLYVARKIGGTLLSIPQLMKQDRIEIEDEAVGIVCPVYAAEMPMMIKDFLKKAGIRTPYFFLIYTYGMGYAAAFAHAAVSCQKAGITLSYINAVLMADNYLPGYDMQHQIDTLPDKDVEGQIQRICKDISDRRQKPVNMTAADLGQMAVFQNLLAKRILRKDAAKSFIVNENCIRCDICTKVCPTDNIAVTDRVNFGNRCEVCYACLHNCPQNAIHIKSEKSSVRFRNENITLKDIMDANE